MCFLFCNLCKKLHHLVKIQLIVLFWFFHLTRLNAQESIYLCNPWGTYRFDLTTCSVEEVNDFSYGYTDIAISASGRVFLITFENLLEIDTNTWEVVSLTFYDYLELNSLITLNNEWLMAAASTGKLYKIHIESSSIIEIGTLDFIPNGDIAFLNGHYYASALNGQLVRFDFDDNSNQISNYQIIGELSFTMGKLFGLTTLGEVTCDSDNMELIGFDGHYVYKIDPENANCTLICTSLSIPGGVVMGATSITDIQSQMFYKHVRVEIPNIFTPNGDEINDYFELEKPPFGIAKCTISIYNRWGNLVYYEQNKDYFKWDGTTSNGVECVEGVYYYTILLEGYCNNQTEQKGFLQLVR